MIVKKMKYAKIKWRECNCWSINFGKKKKTRGYKTLIDTFAKRIEDKTIVIIIIIIITIKQKQKQKNI